MDTFVLARDGDKDVRFEGELLAEVSSSPDNAFPSFEALGMSTTLALYKTKSGSFVVHETCYDNWDGHVSKRNRVGICETVDEIIAVLRRDGDFWWLAKELTEEAELDTAEDID